jgi:hypothetical protein
MAFGNVWNAALTAVAQRSRQTTYTNLTGIDDVCKTYTVGGTEKDTVSAEADNYGTEKDTVGAEKTDTVGEEADNYGTEKTEYTEMAMRVKRRRSANYNPDIDGSSSKDVFAKGAKKSRGKPPNVKALIKNRYEETKKSHRRPRNVPNTVISAKKTVVTKKSVKKAKVPPKIAIDYNEATPCLSKIAKDINTIKIFTKDIGLIRKVVCDILEMQQTFQDIIFKKYDAGESDNEQHNENNSENKSDDDED